MESKDMLERLRHSRGLEIFVLAAVFMVMLLCNVKTPMIADDYAYSFSFADGQRVDSLGDIFSSMAAHRLWMNGRVIPHFLVQLFLMLPPLVFDILNSAVFASALYLTTSLARKRSERDTLLLLGAFCLLWIYTPSFGQVFLWLDGALNYLWSVLFSLLMLKVYAGKFLDDRELPRPWCWLFPLFCFAVGAYCEPSATGTIFCCALLLVLGRILYKQRMSPWLLVSLAAAFAGFLYMILAPGEVNNKSATLTISGLSYGFVNSMELYRQLWPLLLIYLALAFAAWHFKFDTRRQLLALSFILASLAGVFVLSFAGYAEPRSACFGCFMAVAASEVLFPAVLESRFRPALLFGLTAALAATMYWGAVGMQDICESCAQQERNEAIILEARESGAKDVTVEPVYFATKYSAGWGLSYLSQDPAAWNNVYMAEYYGLNSLSLKDKS